ncbi:MAG: hypothetical protein QGI10_03650 [Vicinamibacterales bacterium]|nr:hypothetical protein [Vicinamibacterales bacterium]MDP7692952.1 hypothetical protein [Vicinamibacterales bacterium]HJN46636.1 hypothetical protein [Vicinamibacterales bacterium]
MTVSEAGLVVAYAQLMMGLCLIACVARTRALRVEPSDVLRANG